MSEAIPTDHRPNVRRLEIHVTYRCNLRCNNCSNLIDRAPSNETMSLARIDELLADSIRLGWPWEWLVLHGGEATMHPEFDEVCARLAHYKAAHNPNVRLFLCTNGHGPKVAAGIAIATGHGVEIQDSKKTGAREIPVHIAFAVSAVDIGKDYTLGCFQSSMCGIAYTNQGFFECSPAAAAHRVFGYKPMAERLEDVTEARLATGYADHCKHCGYARVDSLGKMLAYDLMRVKAPAQNAEPGAKPSETWERAFRDYKNRLAGCREPAGIDLQSSCPSASAPPTASTASPPASPARA